MISFVGNTGRCATVASKMSLQSYVTLYFEQWCFIS